MSRPVSPAGLEPIGETSIGHRLEAIQCERRSSHITTQTFKPTSIASGNSDIGVQAHAALSHAARRDRGVRLHATLFAIERLDAIPKTPPTLPCLGARRDPRANGRGREQSQQRLVRRQRILLGIETAAFEDTEHSTSRTGQNAGYIFGLRRRERNERSQIVRGAGIDAIEYENMKVWRQVQRRPEALNESDRAVVSTWNPEEPPRPSSLIGEERTQEGPQDLGHQPCIPGTAVSQGIRKCEYPLTDRHSGKHSIDEPGGCVRHSPAATGRAEASTLAGERDESIVSTCVAMDTQKTMSEYPALQIRTDLSFDEPGDGRTLPPRPSQEGFELFADDLVQKGRLGLVAFVSAGGKQTIGTRRARLLRAIASDVPRSPERDEADARSRLVHLRSRKRLKNRAQPFTRSVETCVLVVARRKMNKRGELSKRHTPGRPKDQR